MCCAGQAYQFTQEAIVKLPPFQIGASTPGASSAPPAQSRLDPNDVVLLNLYSRAYCAYIDRPNKKLHLYLFFKYGLLCTPSLTCLNRSQFRSFNSIPVFQRLDRNGEGFGAITGSSPSERVVLLLLFDHQHSAFHGTLCFVEMCHTCRSQVYGHELRSKD